MKRSGLGFGIIGCGMIAHWHAKAIAKIPGVRLIGATNKVRGPGAAFAAEYGARYFDDVGSLLACAEIDAVCICTPSGAHAELSIEAAKAGKHVVTEKPMAVTMEQVRNVINACEENGVLLSVISQLRFTDAVRKVREAVGQGRLGRLAVADLSMKYYRSQEYYDQSGWRGTWAMDGGGALMNQGIHGIDLMQYIMGPVKSVFACTGTLAREIETEDTAVALLRFENGAFGTVQATTSVYPGMPRRLEICGTAGTVVLEEDCIAKWDIQGERPPMVGKGSENSSHNDPSAVGINGHICQIADFADAVRNKTEPAVDMREGAKPVNIITAIYESARSGKEVFLQDHFRV